MSDAKKVKLMDENGQAEEFEVVEVLSIDENKYALLAPLGDEEDAYVYKVIENQDKEEYVPVEDDEEFEMVLEEYDSLFGDE